MQLSWLLRGSSRSEYTSCIPFFVCSVVFYLGVLFSVVVFFVVSLLVVCLLLVFLLTAIACIVIVSASERVRAVSGRFVSLIPLARD